MMRALAGCVLAMSAWTCFAQEAPSAAEDPVLEKRVMALSEELRCLVCQNQSLADSHADLAVDLRNQVRELMREGKTDDQIREFMVARYGDFVLYKPPVKPTTVVLWVGPFVLLLGGRHKGESYTRLAMAAAGRCTAVIAYGEAAPLIEGDLGSAMHVVRAGEFTEVMARARELAPPGGAVLLSPACSSYDMFRNYEERGARFRAAVEVL